ncbi:hypothetical protein FRAHR75_1040010 [Frankia sp. Hr75.2]|nr:hypothetical protein FRAHR75_1040010 [Frankia sp. Hr75.2]
MPRPPARAVEPLPERRHPARGERLRHRGEQPRDERADRRLVQHGGDHGDAGREHRETEGGAAADSPEQPAGHGRRQGRDLRGQLAGGRAVRSVHLPAGECRAHTRPHRPGRRGAVQQEEGRARGSPGATAGGDSTLGGAALRDASLRAAALGGAAGPVRTARLHPATFRTLD